MTGDSKATRDSDSKVFVLVHGAWGGSYGFKATRQLLHAGGHQVYTPSLTGIGERVHLASPQVTLSTHIADVVNTVLYEDLDDFVLLGFSYGGMVVSGTLDHIADRVSHLVYLDAFVPNDGDSCNQLMGRTAAGLGPGAEAFINPLPRDYEDPVAGAYSEARRAPQPVGTLSERVSLSKPIEEYGIPLTFVKATADARTEPAPPFWVASDRARASAAWSHHEIDSNHMIPSNRPEELAAILTALSIS